MRWLKNGRYYQLNLVSGDHQNPEGRLTEDLRVATDAPIDFAVGVTTASLSALTFIAVLWTIGGALTFSLGGTEITIPGFLVIAAVIYSAIASGTMTIVGNRFVAVSEAKNQAEADYRYHLTRVRENGESIALLGGEEEERAGLNRVAGGSAAALARALRSAHAHHRRLARLRHHRAGAADHPVCAEIPRRLDVARPGDAGGFRLHHRAGRVQLAGRQLSSPRRMECRRAPHRLAHGLARRAGARGDRRRHQPHQARRHRRRSPSAEGFLGLARQRHGGGRRHRRRSSRRASGC